MPRSTINKLCPQCGQQLVNRYNRQTKLPFLGCSAWSPGSSAHCAWSEPLPEYFKMVELGAPKLPGFDMDMEGDRK